MSLASYIEKHAEGAPVEKKRGTDIPAMKEWFAPYPHQASAVDKLFSNKGKLILAHQMGTGKTVTAVYGFEKMRHEGKATKALVVTPAGLRKNFAKNGVEKFTTSSHQIIGSGAGSVPMGSVGSDKDYTVVSYSMFRKDPIGLMKATGADTLILDEFHKVRNEKAGVFKAAVAARAHSTNFIGLTASLVNNNPQEIATLLTISEGMRGMSPREFKRKFTQTIGFEEGFSGRTKKVIGPKNEAGIAKVTAPRIDYVTTSDMKGKSMPRKDVQNVKVPMSDEQFQLYQLALNKLGPAKEFIARRDKNITVKDANLLFAQLTEARRMANSVSSGRSDVSLEQSAHRTPKVQKMLSDTKSHLDLDPNHKVVLYSNLVRGGADVLVAGLRKMGIQPALFVGKGTDVGGSKVTEMSRNAGITEFKKGSKRVIVLTGAGAEGLDLKNATAFYALDGHFNPERILQAEARARRLGGQEFRAPEKRVVDTRRYMSVAPTSKTPGFLGKLVGRKAPRTTDEWMYNVAGRKHKTTKQFYDVIKQPHKYLRKYVDAKGNVRYEYKKAAPAPKKPSFFKRMVGG
jgi:SNF2 family DNA or RNA helicase